MGTLEYDIRHFPFSRYGAMVAVSRDLVKDELVLHDARAHDGQDRALRIIFSDKPFEDDSVETLKKREGIPFESIGTPSKLLISAPAGGAELVISGDHRIHIHAEGLHILLTDCDEGEAIGCAKSDRHFEFVCSGACRYDRIDVQRGIMRATGPVRLRHGKYPVENLDVVLLNPEEGEIDIEVQLAQSPALIDPAVPLEECCRRAEEEWSAFQAKMPPVPEKYRNYSEKAWFALWAA